MFGLTPLGTLHTAISLVALLAGAVVLWRDKEITSRTLTGQIFLIGTVLSCLTGFGIFQRGGFGTGSFEWTSLRAGATAATTTSSPPPSTPTTLRTPC